jgi:hypothetical protein
MMITVLRRITVLLLLALTILVQGCAQPRGGNTGLKPARASLEACCTNIEEYPRWFVDMARTAAPAIGTTVNLVAWRSGHLKSKQAAQEAILDVLQPLDIVLVSSKGKQSGRTIPGLFGHAAVYLGTPGQLQKLGIWASPEVKPHTTGIRNGKLFIEADPRGVHLSKASIVLNTDAVAILRPRISNRTQQRKAALDYFRALGMKFDFLFDVDSPDCTFCTELIHRVMPGLDLPIIEVYGVRTILPDSVAVSAISGRRNLTFVGYIKADRNNWTQASMADLAHDIGRNWAARQR